MLPFWHFWLQICAFCICPPSSRMPACNHSTKDWLPSYWSYFEKQEGRRLAQVWKGSSEKTEQKNNTKQTDLSFSLESILTVEILCFGAKHPFSQFWKLKGNWSIRLEQCCANCVILTAVQWNDTGQFNSVQMSKLCWTEWRPVRLNWEK